MHHTKRKEAPPRRQYTNTDYGWETLIRASFDSSYKRHRAQTVKQLHRRGVERHTSLLRPPNMRNHVLLAFRNGALRNNRHHRRQSRRWSDVALPLRPLASTESAYPKMGGDISWFSSLFEAAESPLESFASKQELIRRRYHCYLQRTHFLFLLCV